ncbi:MAG TPA: winged helix-turn-helix domain-containing protein [Streptosporangiaceae bacterium]
MDLSKPLADVIPGPRGQLLGTLVQLEAPVTVRALARHAGVAPQTALSLVNELAETGLVVTQRVGQAYLVALNRSHVLAQPLTALSRTRARLIERLSRELAEWADLAGAWLLGPVALGSGDRQSGIDICLVAAASTETAAWADATGRLVDHVLSWTGNHAQLLEYSRGSFALLIRDGNQLVTQLREEGVALTMGSRALLRQAG